MVFLRRNVLLNVPLSTPATVSPASSSSSLFYPSHLIPKRHASHSNHTFVPETRVLLDAPKDLPVLNQGLQKYYCDPSFRGHAGSSSSKKSRSPNDSHHSFEELPHFVLQVLAATGGALSAKFMTDESSLASFEETMGRLADALYSQAPLHTNTTIPRPLSPPTTSYRHIPKPIPPACPIRPFSEATLAKKVTFSTTRFETLRESRLHDHFYSNPLGTSQSVTEAILSKPSKIKLSQDEPIGPYPSPISQKDFDTRPPQLSAEDRIAILAKDWAFKSDLIEAKQLCIKGLILLKSLKGINSEENDRFTSSSSPMRESKDIQAEPNADDPRKAVNQSTQDTVNKALSLFEESARMGHVPAAYNAAVLLDPRAQFPFNNSPKEAQFISRRFKNEGLASTFYMQAACAGHKEAQYRLGVLQLEQLSRELLSEQDCYDQEKYENAVGWIQKAASHGHGKAVHLLSFLSTLPSQSCSTIDHHLQPESRNKVETTQDANAILDQRAETDVWLSLDSVSSTSSTLTTPISSAYGYYNLGIRLEEKNLIEDALEAYEKAIDATLDTSLQRDAYFNMGVLFQTRKNDSMRALDCFQKASDLGDEEAFSLCQEPLKN